MNEPAIYRIRVSGRMHSRWIGRFGGLNITETRGEDGSVETVLVGRVVDQAELSGILNSLYESRYPVISVDCLGEI